MPFIVIRIDLEKSWVAVELRMGEKQRRNKKYRYKNVLENSTCKKRKMVGV
jgi:hypothetical protein